MSDDLVIPCPKCGTPVKLTESLAAPFIAATRKKLEDEARVREQKVAKQAAELELEQAKIARERESLAEQLAREVKAERARIVDEERKRALESVAQETRELHQQLEERSAKLVEAQKVETEARRKQRELDDKLREADLAVEKKVGEQLGLEREKARALAADEARLKLAERDQTINALQTKLADALRKAEQGSQQQQGEVQELDLEAALRAAFPRDAIEPVPKGQFGGDSFQRVVDALGQPCGTLLWESKRTRNWSDGWLAKLRGDQRAAKAEIAVIVSQALPSGLSSFAEIDGVWVTTPTLAVALASVLRAGLIETAAARRAAKGQEGKMELLYAYLTGAQFKQRVQAILEGFTNLKRDLESEKSAMQRIWSKREKQLEVVMLATSGMYGDLEGIAGRSMPEIEGLGLEKLGPAAGEDAAST